METVLGIPSKVQTAVAAYQSYGNMRNVSKGTKYSNKYELPESIKKYAAFAQGAYDLHSQKIKGYTIDPMSSAQFRVYKKDGNGKVVFAIRGSKDIFNDFVVNDLAGIAVGKEHLQLKQARYMLDRIKKKYPKAALTLTGHSLGSLTASTLGAENNIRTFGFNAGSSPLGGQKYQDYLAKTFNSPYVTSVVQEGDLVSAAAIKHMRADNLHVIANPDKGLKNTVDRHFMSNFVGNEHLENINTLLKEKNVENREHIVHQLHTANKSDESLQRRHEKLKTSLVGGGWGDQAINEGEYLGSSGFHAAYEAKNNLMELGGQKVPGAGAKIYVNKAKGIMYVFNSRHEPYILNGNMEEMSQQMKKHAHNLGAGPTVLVDDSSGSPPTKQVAFVPALGAQGYDVVPAVTKKDWEYVLGGLKKHGKKGWWAGEKSDLGYVGNGVIDVFQEKPVHTYDDEFSGVFLDIGEGIFHNAVQVASIGAGMVTSGAATAIIEGINMGIDAAEMVTGQEDFLQKQLNKLIPDTRHDNMATMGDIFSKAKTLDGRKPFTGKPDPKIVYDERIPFRLQNLETNWKKVKEKSYALGLKNDEEKKLMKLHPDKAISGETQKQQADALKRLAPKYEFMKHSFEATDKLKNMNHKAWKAGLSDETQTEYSEMRKNMIPRESKETTNWRLKSQDPFTDPTKFEQIVQKVGTNLNNAVGFNLAHSEETYTKEFDKQLGWDKTYVQPLMKKMATQEDFEKFYKGDAKQKDKEYKTYQREMYSAFRKEQGFEFDTTKLHADQKYFVKRYLKDHKQQAPKYIQEDYFKLNPEKFTKMTDSQHDTAQRMLHEATLKTEALDKTKAQVIP